MSGAAHTPGPWKIGNGDIYADGNSASDFDDLVICAIGQAGGFRSHEYARIRAHKPEGRANARLIAAAPDLLEALEAELAYLEEDRCWAETTDFGRLIARCERMEAAIAKARRQ